MTLRIRSSLIIFLGGFLFVLDRFLKHQALTAWSSSYLFKNFIGWSPFLNQGIAFSLPLPALATALITAPILILVGWMLVRTMCGKPPLPTSLPLPMPASSTTNLLLTILLFAGALSNLIDRLIYGHVVDYFRVATGIINLADVLITAGFALYLWNMRKNPATPLPRG